MKGQVFYHLSSGALDEVHSIYGSPAINSSFARANWTDRMELEVVTCAKNADHQRPGIRLSNLEVVLTKGAVGDFIWTFYGECLASSRVVQLLTEAGMTGFDLAPASFLPERVTGDKVGEESPEFFELRVVGSAGPAHPNSGISKIYYCDACNFTEYSSFKNGLHVNVDTWDGSDFFTVSEYRGYILVSDRVKELIIREHLQPCMLAPSHELRWPSGLVRPEEG